MGWLMIRFRYFQLGWAGWVGAILFLKTLDIVFYAVYAYSQGRSRNYGAELASAPACLSRSRGSRPGLTRLLQRAQSCESGSLISWENPRMYLALRCGVQWETPADLDRRPWWWTWEYWWLSFSFFLVFRWGEGGPYRRVWRVVWDQRQLSWFSFWFGRVPVILWWVESILFCFPVCWEFECRVPLVVYFNNIYANNFYI